MKLNIIQATAVNRSNQSKQNGLHHFTRDGGDGTRYVTETFTPRMTPKRFSDGPERPRKLLGNCTKNGQEIARKWPRNSLEHPRNGRTTAVKWPRKGKKWFRNS